MFAAERRWLTHEQRGHVAASGQARELTEQADERYRRVAMNESLFRSANEAIEERRAGAAFASYVCECAQPACALPIMLARFEYEEVRRVPTHFVVAPGHVVSDVERVVAETTRYHVVEKLGIAASVARRLDPRSSS